MLIGLIAYWGIKIPEKNINNLPIIHAITGDLRVEPIEPGGKSFNDENLSIYKNLENGSKVPEKRNIILNKSEQGFVNLGEELNINHRTEYSNKGLTSAIEDALKEVVNDNIKKDRKSETLIQQGAMKLYLGSFDTFVSATEFKKFIKKSNDTLIENSNLKIFEGLEGERKFFRVELINISSKEEGKQLCSTLSRRQFSCLLFSE